MAPALIPLSWRLFLLGVLNKGENRGVGLFLARQQIQNLGGDITVESERRIYPIFVHIPG